MRFDDFLAADRQLTERLVAAPSIEARTALIDDAMEAGERALGAASDRAEQVEITMRLAATAALGAYTESSRQRAESTVIWARRCGRLLQGAAVDAYYLPRLASLVGGVNPLLEDHVQLVIATGIKDWLGRAGAAFERVASDERLGDAYSRVALAASDVEGAKQMTAEARKRARSAYQSAGRPDLGSAIS